MQNNLSLFYFFYENSLRKVMPKLYHGKRLCYKMQTSCLFK